MDHSVSTPRVDEAGARIAYVDQSEQRIVVQQHEDRRSSAQTVFTLPRNDTATLRLSPMRAIHSRSAEIAISRPMMMTAMNLVRASELDQHDQRCGHHQLVGHRIEEGAERGGLVQASARGSRRASR